MKTNKFNIGDVATVKQLRESRHDNLYNLKEFEEIEGEDIRISLIKSQNGEVLYYAFASPLTFYEDELELCKTNEELEVELREGD